jgi:methylmalonyl-CoA mutase N-terminal domain/subunit
MDEALALPSEYAVKIALRTQQLIAHESGVTNTVDPLAGSYLVEALTDRMEQEVYDYFRKVEALGGVIPALEKGFFQREIAEAAYRYQREIDTHQRVLVGVNEYLEEEPIRIPLLAMDPEGYERQVARLEQVRRERDSERVGVVLTALRQAARGTDNTMPYILDCVRAYATLGEIMDVFRTVFGEYREPAIV